MALSQKHPGKMLVPWFNCNEWRYVKELIFGDMSTEETKMEALDILRMWKIRTPNLPTGVAGTLAVLDAMLQDKGAVSEEGRRVAGGSAIMRFVNLCGATSNKQGTLYETAKQNNFPDWLVSLRHDVAHDPVIPSQFMVDLGLKFCLEWVRTEYWEKQSLTLKDYVIIADETNENIKKAVQLYCEMNLMQYLNKNCISLVKDFEFLDPSLSDRIYDFMSVAEIDANMKVGQALDSLLPCIREGVAQKREQSAGLIANILVTNGSIFAIDLQAKNDGRQEIPCDFIVTWQGLIHFLYTENLLLRFLKELLEFCNNDETEMPRRNYASLWLREIFRGLLLAKMVYNKFTDIPKDEHLRKEHAKTSLRTDILSKNPHLQGCLSFYFANYAEISGDKIEILKTEALANPHGFTLNYLRFLLQLCDCPVDDIAKKESLIRAYTVPEVELEPGYQVHTLDDLQELIESVECKQEQPKESIQFENVPEVQAKAPKPKWRYCEDKSILEGCPLGVVKFLSRDVNPLLEQNFKL